MSAQPDRSKTRMNFAAIKKVDPYAKDIVDTSSHVAFYIFNEDSNEWEKTDVEGALFIYSRTAAPFHSIFINNRLNTTAFVEPINHHLELQSQPPFLLYRNERSRIRGFWFYCSEECERLSKLAIELVRVATASSSETNRNNLEIGQGAYQRHKTNIFKLLSNAQLEYNAQLSNNLNSINCPVTGSGNNQGMQQQQQQLHQHQSIPNKPPLPQNLTSGNVLQFFAAAKPTCNGSFTQPILPNTLSVEQVEKQQRIGAPGNIQSIGQMSLLEKEDRHTTKNLFDSKHQTIQQTDMRTKQTEPNLLCSMLESKVLDKLTNTINTSGNFDGKDLDIKITISKSPDFNDNKTLKTPTTNTLPGEQISLSEIFSNVHLQNHSVKIATYRNSTGSGIGSANGFDNKPALMPPTMFDITPVGKLLEQNSNAAKISKREPLTKFQFVQAFNYLMQNDEEFVQQLHDAYLKASNTFNTTY